MAFKHYIYRFRDSIEHEFKYKGNYGAKGEKRAPRKKATPEQIARQNQKNKENNTRRLIKANFVEKDLWICLKYPAGTRPTVEQVKDDKEKFYKVAGREYKKRGSPFKWISRMEIGERGGLHLHFLINRIPESDLIIAESWSKALEKSGINRTQGLVDFRHIYELGDIKALAEYICKKPKEDSQEYEQLSLFPEEEQRALSSISHSRNLVKPEPDTEERSRRTMRKIVDEGPKPTPGYYIDKDSLYIGTNPFTGYSYCKYTEIKIAENRIKTKCGAVFHPPRGDDVR